jgi:hypothetical protein
MAATNPQRFLALGGAKGTEAGDITDVDQEKVCVLFVDFEGNGNP